MEKRKEGAVPGKVIWLEPAHLHFHHGHEARVKVLRGEGMMPEGAFSTIGLKAFVVDPAGNRSDVQVAGVEGGQVAVSFAVNEEGMYTVTVEAPGGIARVMVPVGHHVSGKGKASGTGLEVVPGEYYEYHHNETAEIQVLLNGNPLPGATVWATYHLYEGPQAYPYRLETDEDGIFSISFIEKGHWLFVVEHDRKFATLVVPGVH